jgi:hypothetical protein
VETVPQILVVAAEAQIEMDLLDLRMMQEVPEVLVL